jgi:hypothetical protein
MEIDFHIEQSSSTFYMDQVFRQNVQQIVCNCTDKVVVHFVNLLETRYYQGRFTEINSTLFPNDSATFYRGSI